MEPLLKKIDKMRTIKEVDNHLESFAKIKHYYTVIDAEEGFFLPSTENENNNTFASPAKDKMLSQINKSDYINVVTKNYIDTILNAINALTPYSRKLILLKYFYECEFDELSELVGFSERKVYKDLKDAKVDLAFLLGCEKYYK